MSWENILKVGDDERVKEQIHKFYNGKHQLMNLGTFLHDVEVDRENRTIKLIPSTSVAKSVLIGRRGNLVKEAAYEMLGTWRVDIQ